MNKRAKENYGSIRITDANSVQRAIDELNRRVQALSVKQQAVGTEASDQRTQPIGSIQVADEWNETSSQYESVIRVRGKRGWVTIGNTPGSVIASDVGSTAVGSITATNVQDAIAELEAEINALGGTPAASAVSYSNATSGLSPGSNVQEAIDTLDGLVDTNTTNIGTNTTNIGSNDTEIANLYTLLDRTTAQANFGTFDPDGSNVITANQTLRPILQELADAIYVNETGLAGKLTTVAHDGSLTGTGASGSPLGVATGGIDDTHLNSTASSEAVTTSVIRDGAVTANKIGANAVTSGKINSGAFNNGTLITYVPPGTFHSFDLDGPGSTLSGILVGLDDVPSWLTDTKANLANKSIRMNSSGTAWEWYTPTGSGMSDFDLAGQGAGSGTATITDGDVWTIKGGDADAASSDSPSGGILVSQSNPLSTTAQTLIQAIFQRESSRSGATSGINAHLKFGGESGIIAYTDTAHVATGSDEDPGVIELYSSSTDETGYDDGIVRAWANAFHAKTNRVVLGTTDDETLNADLEYESFVQEQWHDDFKYRVYHLTATVADTVTTSGSAVEFKINGMDYDGTVRNDAMTNATIFRNAESGENRRFHVVCHVHANSENGQGYGTLQFYLSKNSSGTLTNDGLGTGTAPTTWSTWTTKSWDGTERGPQIYCQIASNKLKLSLYTDGNGSSGPKNFHCNIRMEVYDLRDPIAGV